MQRNQILFKLKGRETPGGTIILTTSEGRRCWRCRCSRSSWWRFASHTGQTGSAAVGTSSATSGGQRQGRTAQRRRQRRRSMSRQNDDAWRSWRRNRTADVAHDQRDWTPLLDFRRGDCNHTLHGINTGAMTAMKIYMSCCSQEKKQAKREHHVIFKASQLTSPLEHSVF